MHVLEASSICSESLVERNGVTLVVLPVRDARRDHPLLLFLCCGFPWWTPEYRRRRAGWTTGNLLVLEAWGLERILNNLGHLDDPLFQSVRPILVAGRVPDEGSITLTIRDMLGLRSLDLPVYELLERRSCLFGCLLNLILRRTLQYPGSVVKILPVSKRDKVLKLRLDNLAGTLPLLRDDIVADISFGIHLKCKSIT